MQWKRFCVLLKKIWNHVKRIRIKHNDLMHYFLRPHEELPRAYLASCEKFFRSLKLQAPSSKRLKKDTIMN